MIDDFLTEGLENDRYLKARRLAKEFEKEIEVKLQAIGEDMVDENRELFDDDVEGSKGSSTMSNTFPWARIDYPMARLQARGGETILTLNVHFYWCDPRKYNRTDIDGALCALGYKIKDVAKTDEQRVVSETRDWPIRVAENRFGGEKAFYRHVSSAVEIEETGEQLVDHFSTFGNEFGVPPDG
jgi:hypothetical protein